MDGAGGADVGDLGRRAAGVGRREARVGGAGLAQQDEVALARAVRAHDCLQELLGALGALHAPARAGWISMLLSQSLRKHV